MRYACSKPSKVEALPKAGQLAPLNHQRNPIGGMLVSFEVGVALGTLSGAVVVAESAFQGLQACAEQLAQVILEKGAVKPSVALQRKLRLTALEGQGQHAK